MIKLFAIFFMSFFIITSIKADQSYDDLTTKAEQYHEDLNYFSQLIPQNLNQTKSDQGKFESYELTITEAINDLNELFNELIHQFNDDTFSIHDIAHRLNKRAYLFRMGDQKIIAPKFDNYIYNKFAYDINVALINYLDNLLGFSQFIMNITPSHINFSGHPEKISPEIQNRLINNAANIKASLEILNKAIKDANQHLGIDNINSDF